MTSNTNDLEDVPDKDLKRMAITMYKQLKEDMNITQENRN